MKSYPYQLHLFFNALTYFTRLRAPQWVVFTAESQARSSKYFTWVGLLIGFYTGLIYWLCSFVLPENIAIIFSMLASIWMTGGLHEDGLADTCDGFGGGWDKQKILAIMKDSRVGTYGVIGLICIFLLKFNSLLSVEETFSVLLLGHCTSRFFPLILMYRETYAGDSENSKSSQMINSFSTKELIISALPVLACFVFLPLHYLTLLLPCLLATLWLAQYFRHWIGGYNGDCLGCCQQINEVIIYLWLCLPFFIE